MHVYIGSVLRFFAGFDCSSDLRPALTESDATTTGFDGGVHGR